MRRHPADATSKFFSDLAKLPFAGARREDAGEQPIKEPKASREEARAIREEARAIREEAKPIKEAYSHPTLARSNYLGSLRTFHHGHAHAHPHYEASGDQVWPSEVLALLASVPRGRGIRGAVPPGQPATEGLRLRCGVAQIPHPRKAQTGGEDSFFLCSNGSAAGVADGVGEWGWRFRINPRALADEIMMGARQTAVNTLHDSALSARKRVAAMLRGGYTSAKCFGSATALVIALDARGKELGIANLGDSGMRQLRFQNGRGGAIQLGPKIIHRTREQQHMFNCPYQLTRLPEPEDFPGLLAEGKTALVQAVTSKRPSHQDGPDDADLYSCRVHEGDLLILGTDGLFDNVHDEELCELLGPVVSPMEAGRECDGDDPEQQGRDFTDPNIIASALAMAAFHRSMDKSARTPFGVHAKDAGLYHVGGKMDDITVVAAWVVRNGPNTWGN